MTLLCSSFFIQHSISFVEKRIFVDAVGGWRPNWMRDSGVVGEDEEDGEEVSDGAPRPDVTYPSTRSTKFLPEGLSSRAVSAYA